MLTQSDLKSFLRVATEAAENGGRVLESFWGKLENIREKTVAWDLVTEADYASEKAVLETLGKYFPDHSTLSEEAGLQEKKEKDFLWVVDPLDGTTNYTHQYPIVAVSIGLLYKGKPVVGVVYNPIFKELFQGAMGCGACLNGKKIAVSSIDKLGKALLATGFAYDRKENPENNYKEFCHMTSLTQGVRRGGAAAIDLAYVAAGRLDGFWEKGLKAWDIAAGYVLITEAGGSITDYSYHTLDLYSGMVLASNGKIHRQMCEEIMRIRNEK